MNDNTLSLNLLDIGEYSETLALLNKNRTRNIVLDTMPTIEQRPKKGPRNKVILGV